MNDRKYEDLKEIVDIHIKRFEKLEDQTGEIQKLLAGLYTLSDGLGDYIITFEDLEYEEI